jgi:hypothetical protein
LVAVFLVGTGGSAYAQKKHKTAPALTTQAQSRNDRVAVIGDYGVDGPDLAGVADLIEAFGTDYIVTLGDNSYPLGNANLLDQNIGKYFSDYIANYQGNFGPGALTNDFYPAIGNRDYDDTESLQPYLDYFTLPGNERYYHFRRGRVHWFLMNSDENEPDDPFDPDGIQGTWLENALAASSAPYRVVVLHHRPFVSASTGSRPVRQWPFVEWGADVVLAGHSHLYERIDVLGTQYIVNGLGGGSLGSSIHEPVAGSQVRSADDHAAQLVDVTYRRMRFRAVTNDDVQIDEFLVFNDDQSTPPVEHVALDATWSYLDDGTDPSSTWTQLSFDDALWSTGAGPLGYELDGLATVVGLGPDVDNPYVTTYFRHEFSVTDAGSLSDLVLHLRNDEGAIVYLNDTEVHRVNLPGGAVDTHTLASSVISSYAQDDLYETVLDPADLVSGTNILAVEVHAGAATGLRGEYFDAGTPPAAGTLGDDRRTDTTVDFTWTGNAPDGTTITADNVYSERWDGAVFIEATGSWTFTTTSDENVKLWVDDQLVIDAWDSHSTQDDSGALSFSSVGWYPIRLEHGNETGSSTIKLFFEHSSHAKEIIPSSYLKADYDDDDEEVGETDIVMGLRLFSYRNVETHVAKGADWTYTSGTFPGTGWHRLSFDDTSWSMGAAELGYGEMDEETEIGFGGDPMNKHIAYYFRHEFEVVDASATEALILRLLRDDGAIVYLNGKEIYRSNITQHEVDETTLAGHTISGDEEGLFIETRVDDRHLIDGTNLIAVEVHQRGPTSSDLSFDLELLGRP